MARRPERIRVHTRNRAEEGKPASWQFYFKYYAEDGVRRTISEGGFPTKDAAYRAGEKALDEFRHARGLDNPDVLKMNLAEFVDSEWLPFVSTGWSEATRINRNKLIKYIVEQFGGKKLADISQKKVKSFFDYLYLDTEIATSTVNNIRSTFGQILTFAVDQGYLKVSPLASYVAPNPNENPARCSKNGQVRDVVSDDILEKIYERYPAGTAGYLLLKICEHTGMRIAEAAALAFEDVDFEDRKIYVTRQIKIVGYNEKWNRRECELAEEFPMLADCKYVARNPKYNSKRVVALSQELHDILLEHKKKQERNQKFLGSDYVRYWYTRECDPQFAERTFETFNIKRGRGRYYSAENFENGIINTSGIGYPLHFVNVREDGTLLRPDYGTDMCAVIHGSGGRPIIYEDFNFHSLRNTFASRRRAEGIPEYIISAMLGHKNETTTEKYMKINYAEFDAATSIYRGKASEPQAVRIEDHDSLEAYLKTLDKEALQTVMLSVCTHISAAN